MPASITSCRCDEVLQPLVDHELTRHVRPSPPAACCIDASSISCVLPGACLLLWAACRMPACLHACVLG